MQTTRLLIRNSYGATIVKCCASCEYKRFNNKYRLCLLGEGSVPPSYVCKKWRMSPDYSKVGKGDGRIKKREYLLYVIDRQMEEDIKAEKAAKKNELYRKATLGEIRREYMSRQKTIYETI